MKTLFRISYLSALCLALVVICSAALGANRREKAFIKENTEFAAGQTIRMLAMLGDPTGKNFPRSTNDDGTVHTVGMGDWTSGFFPGSLWYLYDLTEDTLWMDNARKWTEALEPMKCNTGTHDIGFMMYCSYGNAARFIRDSSYFNILVQSAESLSTRYNDKVKAIKSWNRGNSWGGVQWNFPVIIDNMMNLELLFFASKVTGDPKYRDIAIAHANTTLRNHFRDDFSSYHVVNYDEQTGEVLNRQTCQGYSDNSTWARGQAWAVYGFTVVYRETGNKTYLEAAKKMADYFIAQLPYDGIPYWDFNAGVEGYTPDNGSYALKFPEKPRDASAAAIVSSALFELAWHAKERRYRETAVRMLHSLGSPSYRAQPADNSNFILMHSTGSIPHKAEIDVPLNYADYYFLEALVRYRNTMQAR